MAHSNIMVASALAGALLAGAAQAQTTTYITDFTKTDNIYTNLNEQYPHTGTGVPGSGVGTPNATFLFDPSTYNALYTPANTNDVNDANNGIDFKLTSNSAGQDFTEVGSAGFGVSSLTTAINVSNATNVYLLAGAYNGVSVNVTFTGSGGATETFSNVYVPDFNGGGPINSVSGGVSDQTVYRIYDVGAGGSGNSVTGATNYYDLTELGFTLGSQFSGQTLQSATITANGFEGLILGETVISASAPSAAPEPSAWALMTLGVGAIGYRLRRRKRGGALAAALA